MMKKLILLLLFLVAGSQAQDKATLPILPQPQFYEFNSGELDLINKKISISGGELLSNSCITVLDSIKKIICDEYKSNFVGDDSQINLVFLLSDFSEIPQRLKVPVKYHDNFNSEGYCLTVTPNEIKIIACTNVGLFYGLHSLRQLLRSYAANQTLPELSIIDYPHFKFRGMMDDISRGPIPNLEYMKLQVRRLAELKYNYLMYYIEHVIKTKSHPEFAPDGALTIEEIKELSEYADSHHVKLLGSFQSFGHFEDILSHPKYTHLGERGTILSPALEESYSFLNDIYAEIVPAFDALIFNVNCDETFDLGKGHSKEIVEQLGYAEVYRRHLMRLYNELKKYNTRMMIWGDIVLKYPEILDNLPKDILIGMWDYGADIDVNGMTDPIIEKGFELLIIPGILNSNRLYPDYEITIANADNVLKTSGKKNVLGSLVTVWDDGGFAFFGNDWYGLAYNANIAWRFQSIETDKFNSLYSNTILNDELGTYTSGQSVFNNLLHLQPTYSLNDRVLKIPIIDIEQRLIGVSLEDWDDVNGIASQVNKIINSTSNQNYKVDLDCLNFTNNIYKTLAQEKLIFFDFNAHRVINKKLIFKVINDFKNLEEELEKIWSYENRNHFLEETKNLLVARRKALEKLSAESIADYNVIVGNGKFFLEWLITKPIRINSEKEFDKNYLSAMGDEGSVQPKVTQEFLVNGEINRWSRFVSPIDAMNIFELIKDGSSAIIYLYATIDSDNEQEIEYSINTDVKHLLYLNGVMYDENNSKLKLMTGKNHLMIKLYSSYPELLFSINVKGVKVVNNKNRYKIIYLK